MTTSTIIFLLWQEYLFKRFYVIHFILIPDDMIIYENNTIDHTTNVLYALTLLVKTPIFGTHKVTISSSLTVKIIRTNPRITYPPVNYIC